MKFQQFGRTQAGESTTRNQKAAQNRALQQRSRGSLMRDQRGMSTVEYIILLAVIVVGAVSIWKSIGGKMNSSLQSAQDELQQL